MHYGRINWWLAGIWIAINLGIALVFGETLLIPAFWLVACLVVDSVLALGQKYELKKVREKS